MELYAHGYCLHFEVRLKFVFVNVNRNSWEMKKCFQLTSGVQQGRELLGVNITVVLV